MAETRKASEILRDTLGISPNQYNLWEFNARRYAMTDAEVEEAILKQIEHSPEMDSARKNGITGLKMFLDSATPIETGKTKTFSAKNVLEAIGAPYNAKNKEYDSPEAKLVALYKSNPNKVYNAVYRDKDFGAWGAYNLDKLVNAAANYKKPKPEISMPNKIAGSMFYPRALEAMEAGNSPSAKDIIGDVGEDLLMAIPVGAGAAALVSKLPRAVKAAQVAGALGANSMVPLIAETYDANAYKPEENLDRSVFQPSDVILGAATNTVAPYVAGRMMSRGSRMLGVRPLRETAENLPAGGSEEAKKVVNNWIDGNKFVAPSKEMRGSTQMETWRQQATTRKANPEYRLASEAERAYRGGNVNEANKKGFETAQKHAAAFKKQDERSKIAAGFMQADPRYVEAMQKRGKLTDLEFKQIYADAMDKAMKIGDDEANELLRRIALNDNPPGVKKSDVAKAALESFLVNRYGNQKHANLGLGMVDNIVENFGVVPSEELEEYRDKRKKDARNSYRGGIAAQVLADMDMAPRYEQSDVDAKWLGEIYANPAIVGGEGIGSTAEFKNWWNTRGIKLLGGYGSFPGTKD